MIELEQYKIDLAALSVQIQELGVSLNIPRTMLDIEELESKAGDPAFWGDLENSQKVLQRTKELKMKVERFEKQTQLCEDLMTLVEMGMEEDDASVLTEIKDGFAELKANYDKLMLETLLTGEYDKNNAILTLHAGAGGTEAQDWVEMLFRMYTRWCEDKGFELKTLDYLDGEEAGIKSVTFEVSGVNAYGYLKAEKGVHRLVRISPFDSSGRRHTSFASLDVMPEMDENFEIKINPDDLRVDTYRASGAGGQHINKTSSAIRITHIPTNVVVTCQTQRSQHQNKDYAMKMLYAKLMVLKEQEHKEKIEDLKGVQLDIAWGSQIRSYVFCPYTMVNDHRTGVKVGDLDAVMNGDLDVFINAFLSGRKADDAEVDL
ncbi:MAG: peptide chain release factor 2 [Clostridia bacterium]